MATARRRPGRGLVMAMEEGGKGLTFDKGLGKSVYAMGRG